MSIPNSVQRILVAVFGIPIVYFSLRQGGIVLLLALDVVIVLCLVEFVRLLKGKGFRLNRTVTVLGALAISWDVYSTRGEDIPLILFGTLVLTLVLGLFGKDRETSFIVVSLTLFGVFFVGFCISCILLIRQFPAGADLAILLFLVVWVCDTAAYFVGLVFGRHKLLPHISPNKTVEGTAAGLMGAYAAAVCAKLTFLPGLSMINSIAVGTIAGVLGQLGDLIESAFKRGMEVKDSSRILPGHGGFLDRFDSLLLAAPSMYCYLTLIGSY